MGGVEGTNGVTSEWHPLVGPKTRETPPPPSPRKLTVFRNDLGAQVEFINFTGAFSQQAVYTSLNWTAILKLVIGTYSLAEWRLTLDTADSLPKGTASGKTRRTLKGIVYAAHLQRTGTDIYTGEPPDAEGRAYAAQYVSAAESIQHPS